jgi:exodeoxyribonuclease VII large subunit
LSNSKQAKPQSVSQLSQAIKYSLNTQFPSVWVAGEISGMTKASSGHIYLTLKDQHAQISGIIWRSDAEDLKFEIKNGMEVECRGNVDVYTQRGSYQINIRKLRPKGVGAHELAFRQLHAKLAAEGLFDPTHKKSLPTIPQHVAVVTSPTGAAIRDFLQVLTRRWGNIRVTIVPVKVQGPVAAAEIAAAIRDCNRMHAALDAIVVTRGGGSVEDLWSFNEESVVRAIHESVIPVVSGVGHEIDVTLSDLVADVRALTPSEAAERLVPNYRDVVAMLDSTKQRMTQTIASRIQKANQQLAALASRTVITQPLELIRQTAMELDFLENSMNRSARQKVSKSEQELEAMAARMNAISPLAVLARGYSLTTDKNGKLVLDAKSVNPGDKISTRLANGVVKSTVDETATERQ